MIDLETLGKGPRAVIVSIGCCEFELQTAEIGKSWQMNVSCAHTGLEIDESTVRWWMRQDDAARANAFDNEVPLREGLLSFVEFVCEDCCPRSFYLWANSPSFDVVILRSAFDSVFRSHRPEVEFPFKYWNWRDYRTVMALLPRDPKKLIELRYKAGREVKHRAVDDAVYQARCLCAARYWLEQRELPPNDGNYAAEAA
jgi:exodeoxyribonuclease VIII